MTQYTPQVDLTIFPRVNFYKTFGTRFQARADNGRIFGSTVTVRERLFVEELATVTTLNPFVTGCDVDGTTAVYDGGQLPVTYEYIWQGRAVGGSSWTNVTSWVAYDNTVIDVKLTSTFAGSYKLTCRATDVDGVVVYSTDQDYVQPILETSSLPEINPTLDFIVGDTIAGLLAGWTGGYGQVTYQYGFQYKKQGDASWNQEWIIYDGSAQSKMFTIPEGAIQLRLTCTAADTNGPIFVNSQTFDVTNPPPDDAEVDPADPGDEIS